jgi:aspartate/methionine/tyrosine aminotransferase
MTGADRLSHFELPPQWSTMREAAALESGGRHIIHMEKGDYASAEFKPPPQAWEALRASLEEGYVRYSPGAGIMPLREAIAEKMTERGRPTTPEEVIVTPGAKFGITSTMLLFLDRGDEVIMPNPGYPPDEFWARYLQARIRHVTFRDPRNVDTEHLEKLISSRSRLVILNSPQRPNGQLIENIEEVAAVLERHPQVMVASDEIFSQIVYPPYKHRSLSEYPGLKERTVIIDTFSKSYVMTGLRIGWIVAPANIASKFDILLQNSFTNVATIIQEAALAALNAPASYHEEMLTILKRKRDLAFSILRSSKILSTDNAQGSFYLFPRLPEGLSDREAVRLLLNNGVAVVPGSAFGSGGSGHIRLTFTLEDGVLEEGVRRLVRIIEERAG